MEYNEVPLNRTPPIGKAAGVRTYRVALFGLGVVGSGFCRLLNAKAAEIEQRFSARFEIAGVVVRDPTKIRAADLNAYAVTDKPEVLLSDPSIDVAIELIGGHYEALHLIESSLSQRKHVITANKLLLSKELPRLRERARRQGVLLEYSASVCGSVPVLQAIDECRGNDEIEQIRGIVNGSTNYILTAMSESGISFEEACGIAREQGFLEADPSLDLSGQDAAQKLSVMAFHAFDRHVKPRDMDVQGIEAVTAGAMKEAESRGKRIKLIASASKNASGEVCCSVKPEEVDSQSLFASTRDEFNILALTTRYAGERILYGKGAGSYPTASAVLSDLIKLTED